IEPSKVEVNHRLLVMRGASRAPNDILIQDGRALQLALKLNCPRHPASHSKYEQHIAGALKREMCGSQHIHRKSDLTKRESAVAQNIGGDPTLLDRIGRGPDKRLLG